jgi:hypothetical protein
MFNIIKNNGSSRVLVEPAKPGTSPKYNLLIHNKSLPCSQPARQAKTHFEGPVPQEPSKNQYIYGMIVAKCQI